ncbi:MAG: hypothetical protein V3W52_17350 [Syntrophobacteria bacterium]
MANGINPLISLQARAPSTGPAFQNALLNIQRGQDIAQQRALAPLQQRLTEAQVSTAEAQMPVEEQRALLQTASIGAQRIIPLLESGNIQAAQQVIDTLPDELRQEATETLRSNPGQLLTESKRLLEAVGSRPGQKFGVDLTEAVTPEGERVFLQTSAAGPVREVPGFRPPRPTAEVKLEQTKLEAEQKKQARLEGERVKASTALANIDTAIGQAGNLGTTGFVGGLTSAIPGTPAFDLNQSLQPVRALISFKALNDMRAASPTGGALGNVTERELALLSSTMGSLEQGQSTPQLVDNLRRVQVIMRSVIDPLSFGAVVFTKDQFDKIPSGQRFIDGTDDGKLKVKP